jgi:hypothetical protein
MPKRNLSATRVIVDMPAPVRADLEDLLRLMSARMGISISQNQGIQAAIHLAAEIERGHAETQSK